MHAGCGDGLARSDVLTGEVMRQPELAQMERRVPNALDKGFTPGDLPHLPCAPQLLRWPKTPIQRCRCEGGQRGRDLVGELSERGHKVLGRGARGDELGRPIPCDRLATAKTEGIDAGTAHDVVRDRMGAVCRAGRGAPVELLLSEAVDSTADLIENPAQLLGISVELSASCTSHPLLARCAKRWAITRLPA